MKKIADGEQFVFNTFGVVMTSPAIASRKSRCVFAHVMFSVLEKKGVLNSSLSNV
jgi:hypothetical protein